MAMLLPKKTEPNSLGVIGSTLTPRDIGGIAMSILDALSLLGVVHLSVLLVRGFWGSTRIPPQDPLQGSNTFW